MRAARQFSSTLSCAQVTDRPRCEVARGSALSNRTPAK